MPETGTLLRAVALRRARQHEQASQWYREAFAHATLTFEKRQVLREQAVLAHARQHPDQEITFLLEQAELEPSNAWSQGLVAEFHMQQRNFKDAVAWWEKTIAPFPRAVQQLAKARDSLATR